MKEKIKVTTQFLKEKGIQKVELGILLGTGLERLSDVIKIEKEIPYSEIPETAKGCPGMNPLNQIQEVA